MLCVIVCLFPAWGKEGWGGEGLPDHGCPSSILPRRRGRRRDRHSAAVSRSAACEDRAWVFDLRQREEMLELQADQALLVHQRAAVDLAAPHHRAMGGAFFFPGVVLGNERTSAVRSLIRKVAIPTSPAPRCARGIGAGSRFRPAPALLFGDVQSSSREDNDVVLRSGRVPELRSRGETWPWRRPNSGLAGRNTSRQDRGGERAPRLLMTPRKCTDEAGFDRRCSFEMRDGAVGVHLEPQRRQGATADSATPAPNTDALVVAWKFETIAPSLDVAGLQQAESEEDPRRTRNGSLVPDTHAAEVAMATPMDSATRGT